MHVHDDKHITYIQFSSNHMIINYLIPQINQQTQEKTFECNVLYQTIVYTIAPSNTGYYAEAITFYLQVPDATVYVEACSVTVMVVVTIEMLDVTTQWLNCK